MHGYFPSGVIFVHQIWSQSFNKNAEKQIQETCSGEPQLPDSIIILFAIRAFLLAIVESSLLKHYWAPRPIDHCRFLAATTNAGISTIRHSKPRMTSHLLSALQPKLRQLCTFMTSWRDAPSVRLRTAVVQLMAGIRGCDIGWTRAYQSLRLLQRKCKTFRRLTAAGSSFTECWDQRGPKTGVLDLCLPRGGGRHDVKNVQVWGSYKSWLFSLIESEILKVHKCRRTNQKPWYDSKPS